MTSLCHERVVPSTKKRGKLMKVLMFGWEFPPMNNGGLGTACFGLTKGLCNQNIQVTFVLPKASFLPQNSHVNLLVTDTLKNVKIKEVNSSLVPYIDSKGYESWRNILKNQGSGAGGSIYGENLFEEVERYAEAAKLIAEFEEFDVIHAHDWMTYRAGKIAKKISGKPLVVHIHATDFDRTGGHPNQQVYDIEREGFHEADKIIAVSNYTKGMVVKHYGIHPDKVVVVHNAVEQESTRFENFMKGKHKTVLFLGRITLQKGPDYFLEAAKKVCQKDKTVRFIMAGTGDMMPAMIEKAAHLGIADRVLFSGFLTGQDIDRAYQMADLYVMPSVSEPFGITPLEALKNKTPVIISKQSGVSEVLRNALKVDFWDVNELANKMLAVLRHTALRDILVEEGHGEVRQMTWDNSAKKCIDVYHQVLQR